MRIAILTNTISPHQMPLARALAERVGDDNIRYVHSQTCDKDHKSFDWSGEVPNWCFLAGTDDTT